MLTLLLLASLAVSEPPSGEALAASYKKGSITVSELERWQRYQSLRGIRADRRQAIEDLVVVEELASRLPAAMVSGPELTLERQILEIRLADEWLERQLKKAAEPSEATLQAEYSRDPTRYHRPKRWRLSNLLLQVATNASAEERSARRQEAADLLDQIRNGADFATLAERHSDSATRLRRGDMGFVPLAKLQPAVARVVAGLQVDSLSPVIEIRDGFLILLCTAVLEAEERSFEEAKTRIAGRLRTRALATAKTDLEASLLARLAPSREPAVDWDDPESVVATYRIDGERRSLRVGELTFFARTPRSKPLPQLSAAKRSEALDAYLLARARAAEAERRGCWNDPDQELLLHFRMLELQAQKAANRAAEEELAEPAPEALDRWIERHQESLDFPATSHLRALVVHREAEYGVEYFDRLRQAGERLRAEGGSLETVAQELAPHAEIQDFGWRTESQIWTLGRNLELVWRELATGELSSVVQEGPKLYLLERAGDRPRRRLSTAEARQQARSALRAAERRRFGRHLRQAILEDQGIELIP